MQALPDEAARILDAEAGSAPFYLGYGFVVGVVAMWLYSALAPRYGSGWKPAAYVGVALFSLYEAKYIILDVFFVQQPLITVGFNVAVMLAACVGGMIAGARLGEVVG